MNIRGGGGFDIGQGAETADNQFIQVRDFPTGEIRHTLRNVSGTNIAFSRDSRLAVMSAGVLQKSYQKVYRTVSVSTSPVVLDVETGKTIELPEGLTIGGALLTSENKVLLAGIKSVGEKLTIQVLDRDLKSITSTGTTIISSDLPELVPANMGDRALVLLNGALLVLNSETGQIVTSINGAFQCAEFSKNGQLIVTGDDTGSVKIFAAATGDLVASFKGHPISANSVSFTADDQHLVIGGDDKVLRIWRIRPAKDSTLAASANPTSISAATRQNAFGTFEPVAELTGHVASITSVKISHSGDVIITTSTDGTARLWDLRMVHSMDIPLEKIEGQRSYSEATFSPLGDSVITVGRSAHLWNTRTGAHVAELRAFDSGAKHERVWFKHAVFSNTGKLILIDRENMDDSSQSADLYDSRGRFLARLPGSINAASRAAFSPDEKFVALAEGNVGLIWSTTENRVVRRLSGHVGNVASIAFSPTGKLIISVGKDGTARLWSFPGGRPVDKKQIHSKALYDTAFSLNGRYAFIVGDHHTQWLWDTVAHKTKRLPEHDQAAMKWGFSNDSTLVFTTSLIGKTLIHKTSDGKIQTSISTVALAFSANGKFLIDTQLRVWETKSGVLSFSPISGTESGFWAMTLNQTQDNQLIAITSDASIVRRPLEETSSLNTLLSIALKRTKKLSK